MLSLVLLIFLSGCEKSVEKRSRNVSRVATTSLYTFNKSDKKKDIYIYPTDISFEKGDFNISSFEIKESSKAYIFVIEIENNFKNNLDMPKGWDLQTFDIYLSLDRAKHFQSLAGRRVKFSSPWTKCILVSPLENKRLRNEIKENNLLVSDDISEIENLSKDILLPEYIEIKGNQLSFEISKDDIDLRTLKKLQLFASSVDPYEIPSIRRVNEHASQWNFGGGSYSDSHPNVIDILGSNDKLLSYSKSMVTKEFAEVDMISVENEVIKG